ncbi:hypothetical protein ACFVXG_30765 [Kitasatospora sp. NPDC058162]|uniref:hypothetical protein n=1 Tax=Kitasatospora sp. NPDC058162 TaxID=3346362 RepID=UPI0036D96898
MSTPQSQPAPAAGVSPPSPLPPEAEALRRAAVPVGAAYAKFEVLSEDFCDMFLKPLPLTSGVVLWDRLDKDDRLAKIAIVQNAYTRLPPLPTAANPTQAVAVRQGFSQGANATYENERFKSRALWVAAELAKIAIFTLAASPVGAGAVSVTGIGSAFTVKWRDCAAQTTARVVLEMTGVEVDAAVFVRRFGLPRETIGSFKTAVDYSLHWFEQVGIKLSPKPVEFRAVANGGVDGHYVIFMRGGSTGGHVVYGRVNGNALAIIDNQLGGRTWDSVMSAERVLQMQVAASYRIENLPVP